MPSKLPIILGIDPGFGRIGIAVIEKDRKEKLLHSECFETDAKADHSKRLLEIYKRIDEIVEKWKPDILAIETLFFNKNISTGIKVAEARGVVISLAEHHQLLVCEYNPLEVKSAVAGYGKATKQQMTTMIPKLISIQKKIKYDDEFDAIAIALTCSAIHRPPIKTGIKTGR